MADDHNFEWMCVYANLDCRWATWTCAAGEVGFCGITTRHVMLGARVPRLSLGAGANLIGL
jgi:hypothetical protein